LEFNTIRLEKRERVAVLTLDRPQALNALSPEMVGEIHQALAQVKDDEEIKALVITAKGRAFSAGADLKFTQQAFEQPKLLTDFIYDLNRLLFALEALPIPVIAVVRGFALAGGLELAMACDLVLAAEDATLGDYHINYALIPGGGNTQRLPRKLGLQKALYLLFSGASLSGRQAQDWGLVYKAVPAERLEGELQQLLDQLKDKSRPALAAIKRAVYRGWQLPNLRDAVEYETLSFTEYITTCDHARQGVQAFVEKRRPQF